MAATRRERYGQRGYHGEPLDVVAERRVLTTVVSGDTDLSGLGTSCGLVANPGRTLATVGCGTGSPSTQALYAS